jgi:hypothetical protein
MRKISICADFFVGVALCLPSPSRADSVMAAYQKIYGMNFEICRPAGLPAGWFATFDGYPVAQVAPNHWVYGRVERPGELVPTDVAVGSVAPMDIPELARTAVPLWSSGAYEKKTFQSIAFSKLDNMGVLDDSIAYTPIAWKSGSPGLRIWLGKRWYRVVPGGGQSTAQALAAQYPFIVRTLRERNEPWTRSDTRDLADLAREWGFVWRGHISFATLSRYRDGFRDGGGGDVFASPSGAGEPGGGAGTDNGGGGQWDAGSGGNTGGGSGGGWDTGDGNNSGGGSGGGGWDR